MARLIEVGRSMPVGALIAAVRLPAGQALAKVDPGRPDLEAGATGVERVVDVEVRFEMLTDHVAAFSRRRSAPDPISATLAPQGRGSTSTEYGPVLDPMEAREGTLAGASSKHAEPEVGGAGEKVERETGFEPATFCLGSRHSAS